MSTHDKYNNFKPPRYTEKQSMLIMLDDIFPECQKLNKDTSLPRLSCWTNPNSCFTGSYTVCMSTLVERVYRIFDVMKDLELIILHWKSPHPGAPKDIRSWGLVIDRDENSQMKISTLNKNIFCIFITCCCNTSHHSS